MSSTCTNKNASSYGGGFLTISLIQFFMSVCKCRSVERQEKIESIVFFMTCLYKGVSAVNDDDDSKIKNS